MPTITSGQRAGMTLKVKKSYHKLLKTPLRCPTSSLHMSMSILHVYVHIHAACPCPCCMPVSMLHVHVRAACPCPWCMSMSVLRLHIHSACSFPCSCCMSMSCSCCMLMPHAACPCPCLPDLLRIASTAGTAPVGPTHWFGPLLPLQLLLGPLLLAMAL
jgi:hypothetical protein